MKNFIGVNIKYLCAKKNLSQKEFGALFNASQSSVGGYISGRSEPNIEALQIIAQHFSISIDSFINVDLSQEEYSSTPQPIQQLEKPKAHYESESKIIAAHEKTILTLEKQVALHEKHAELQDKHIELLEDKLTRAS